ncbi:FAD:protein FMN transferase [Cellulomonas humilata]|uniref:FAD:protein FMN transferase n=1 Tax=Cellulomonas humilata TaxID=144055 RepID=A0ABU0EKV6_9CELL|nr:FAD:protein FMN transferase [Cellulomonas humilata]MDQ0375827.1 thiamine biosynthesis lipoprotein [Cellulomonas humilata]
MRHLELVMGIPMSVDVRGAPDERAERAAVQEAFERMHAADRRFSRFRPDSEVSRYDDDGEPSPDLREVLGIAARFGALSGGAFSVRRPDGSLDTDGVVKGWAAQRAADTLLAAGLTTFCLNAGGDVVVRGEPEPGRGWHVGVRDPSDPQSFRTVLEVRDGAVATSGTYERGEHVWDGRSGQPATGLRAATVVAADLTTADVLATCVLALGRDGIAWAAEHGAVAVLAVDADGELLTALQAAPA